MHKEYRKHMPLMRPSECLHKEKPVRPEQTKTTEHGALPVNHQNLQYDHTLDETTYHSGKTTT